MTIVVICLLIVVLMPLVAKVPLAIMMHRSGQYDNRHPRAQQAALTGFGARTHAAHQNCFEATTYFAPTVLLVLAVNATDHITAYLSIAFVVCRLAYLVCYWADYHIVRSTFWVIGMATVIAHYVRLLSAFS
ncbi:MAPEG family protein [Glaciecola sp. KUL10]|uniref:MAPEG family protein n=1 Tax=Glaciecola sp. (strain KUL10) TaxID=2161813 RepID=UPI000D789957|nr:MAPEG family protein [Glaciecola sp. KUL10]GBL05556.1 transmembrane protein [Glaciecola sp. KUL10]